MEAAIKSIEGKLYINNEYVVCQNHKFLTVSNPATGKTVSSHVANANTADVDLAVSAAETAFRLGSPWRTMDTSQRARLMWKAAELLREPETARMVSEIESHCFGKPISTHMRYDVEAAAENLEYFAGWCTKIPGDCQVEDSGNHRQVRREPIGIVAGIMPWNGPTASIGMKVGPALAAGNVIILKPSEKTPLGALYLADIFRRAGFPPGVVQVITGDGSTGAAFASHMKIRKISFTGSLSTGRKIQEAAAKSNLKRVTLELGGKSPIIVFDDADLDLASTCACNAIASNSGQYCIAGSRIYVHQRVLPKFLDLYKAKLTKFAAGRGDPMDPATIYGPVADKMQFERIQEFIKSGRQEAEVVLDEKIDSIHGYYINLTVFCNPIEGAKIYKEEIFGPVSVVKSFLNESEVLDMANDTEFGLMASVFTKDISRAAQMSDSLQAGTVCINTTMSVSPKTPFGGHKQSGYGSEGGLDSVLAHTQVKTVVLG